MNKVAVVTGGARRLGRAIAIHLHELGFDIALHYCNSVDSANALAGELLSARSNSCQLFQADLRDHACIPYVMLVLKVSFIVEHALGLLRNTNYRAAERQ